MALISESTIPKLEELTSDWWGPVLKRAGFDATVRTVRTAKIGTGQMARNIRFNFEYDNPAARAPATLVGKFPSTDAKSVEAARMFGSYRREVNFYREFSASSGLSTPPLIYADIDDEAEQFILIMGDLAPAEPGDQTKGLTIEQTKLALIEAAKLHASHWEDPSIQTLPWLFGAPGTFRVGQSEIEGLWGGFRERFADELDSDTLAMGDVLIQRFEKFLYDYTAPKCLIHNDFRPDNMAFGGAQGGEPITVFDWQTVGAGAAMNEIAYFMGGALAPKIRAAEEEDLLKLYHAKLTALGVSDYSFDKAWHDYRRFAGAAFAMAVAMAMMAERTERGDEMFLKTLNNSAEMMRTLDTIAVIEAL